MQDFNQEIYDALSEMMTARMEEGVHTSAPAKVGKVENNNTAELTPELSVTTDDGTEIQYPKISGTTILMPCGKGGEVGFAFPVVQGDGCIALFGEGSSGSKFDLANAMLLPGLFMEAGKQVKEAGNQEAAIMFAGDSTIVVKKDEIVITRGGAKITVKNDSTTVVQGGTTIKATGSGVDVTASQVKVVGNVSIVGNATVTGQLTAGGINMNTHTHTCSTGPTSPPVL